jgi:hypothetical protein
MPHRIPLPLYTRKLGSPIHPFPYQLSTRTLELLQGATFYPAFMDAIAGQYRDNNKNMMEQIHDIFIANGMTEEDWELSAKCLTKYMNYLPHPVIQAAVVESLSHWDWYVGKLGRFIEFARQYGPKPIMSRNAESKLSLISLQPFTDQIQILEEASGNALQIADSCINDINEMVLVRNIGVHCQWEVTAYYLKLTKTTGWSLGDVREVNPDELEVWRDALYGIIHNTCSHFAKMYAKVPDFDPYVLA